MEEPGNKHPLCTWLSAQSLCRPPQSNSTWWVPPIFGSLCVSFLWCFSLPLLKNDWVFFSSQPQGHMHNPRLSLCHMPGWPPWGLTVGRVLSISVHLPEAWGWGVDVDKCRKNHHRNDFSLGEATDYNTWSGSVPETLWDRQRWRDQVHTLLSSLSFPWKNTECRIGTNQPFLNTAPQCF
jgi:hypothetical protein